MKKIAWALSLFSMVFVSLTDKMYAQSAPEYTIASPGYVSMPFAINCDMFETGPGPNQSLKAVVWNDANNCYLFLEHNGVPITTPYIKVNPGTTVPGTTSSWLAWQPDVVIGEDPNNPNSGVYYIAVIYWDDNAHKVFLSNFEVDLNGTPATVTPITTALISTPGSGLQAEAPHIDMIPDPSTGVLHDYVAVWDEYPSMGYVTYGIGFGEISASSQTPVMYHYRGPVGTGPYRPDVAGLTDGTNRKFYVVYESTTSTTYIDEINLNPAGPTYLTQISLDQPLTNFTKNNRIEAMNVYNASTNPAKWMVAGMTNTAPSEVWAESNLGPQNCSVSTDDHLYPVVAAGIGSSAGNPNYIGNSKYVVGWCINASPNPELKAVDISLSNMMGTAIPVTSSPVYWATSPPMAISSSSNTGNGLLTAWYDLNDIKYKVSATGLGSGLAFKPTSVNSLDAKSKISLYPNPATDQLNIANAENMKYSITSISGVQIQQGKIESKNASLNINSLPAGIYMLELKNGGGQTRHKFVKQ